MKLCRNNFKNVINSVENEIVCSIPIGTKSSKITEIDSECFYDWKKLEYVYIPSSISVVRKNAFLWNNIKIVFMDSDKTIIEDIPTHIKVLPILGNEFTLFEMLSEVMEVRKRLEFDPSVIDSIDRDLRVKTEEFVRSSKSHEEEIEKKQKELEATLDKLNNYTDKSREISENLISRLDGYITSLISNCTAKEKSELERFSSEIKKELGDLNEVINKVSNTKEMLINFQNSITNEINNNKSEIDSKLDEYKDSIIKSYEKIKNEILDSVVSEATKVIIEKNPCKNIIININDCKKKFESKDLFHKDFEKILRLVANKYNIMLKGPAGSGKNVIIEQVAKALDLQFYYLNDVTEEYKVMGFVDANGRYVETQFYKAFTNGGLMFIDEIDNSNPSALLSINAAIGTGYNNYMAFPDGEYYKAHENFYLVAAANTFGVGADMIYSGRQALDGASLNRFLPVTIDYDKDLEKSLVTHPEILELYWNIRDIVQGNTMRHVISTRNIKNASDLIDADCFSLGDIFDWTIIQGLDIVDLNVISSRIKGNDYYSTEFVKHLQKNYNVSGKL